jgi:chromosome segregation ATPase
VVFSDTYINSTEAYALLDDGTGYYYNKANGALDDTHGPTVLHWLYDQWQNSLNADKVEDAAAVQQLASVNAALQQANNDKTTLARQHSDDQTTIQNLQDQVAKLEAQVSELQDQVVNAPTPAPVAPVVDQQAEDAKVALENIAQLLAQYMAPKA